jgi:hypothetical protein
VRRFAVIKERHPDDWYDVCKQFCEDAGKKPWSLQHVYNMMNYSKTVLNLGLKPTIPEKHVRPLTSLEPEVQKEIWGKISKNGDAPKPEQTAEKETDPPIRPISHHTRTRYFRESFSYRLHRTVL